MNNGAGWFWNAAGSGTAGNVISYSTYMNLTNGGRLAIGNSSPTTKLHVSDANGNNGHNGDNSGLVLIESTYGTSGGNTNASLVAKNYFGYSQFMQWENYGLRFGVRSVSNSGAGAIVFTSGNDVEGMRLDSSGNLLVGTTSAVYNAKIVLACASGSQSVALAIASGVTRASGTQYGYTLYRDNTTETSAVTFVENGGSGNNAASYVVRTNAATGGAGVTSVSGGVALVNGATSWSSYSDLRLKHDVTPVTNAIESILKIDPIFFKWNDRPADQQRSIGVSAQSVEKVFPELIDRSGIYDVEGGAMQVRYTELIPVLLASIQEQQALIVSLKARLDAANL
jgi:hypothetical protein